MVRFRNRRGEQVKAEAVSATQAKNELGSLLERVTRGETIVITKHDAPKAVLISIEEYESLTRTPESPLDSLNKEFDKSLARMQTTRARSGMKRAYEASPIKIGKAAVSAARKRG